MPRLLPNWLEAYLIYTHESESPELFHLWTGLSMIAGAIQRHCWFDMGYYELFPNLYVVLVSPPGRCKKSTAMRIGRQLAADIEDYKFGFESTSREKLIRHMVGCFKNKQSALTVQCSEFASFFATSKENMMILLTDLYECPPVWTHDTLGGATQTIKAPFLNLIAGTTPESLVRDVPVEAIGVGLTSRVFFIHEDSPRIRRWRPTLSPDQKELRSLLAADLLHIHQTIEGSYDITSDFDAHFELRYGEGRKQASLNHLDDSRLDPYFDRKPDHLKKVCMIIAASRHDEMILTLDDLLLAEQLLSRAEARMPLAFSSVGRNPLAQDISNVLAEILSQPGGVSKGELVARFRWDVRAEELDEVLATLMVTGEVTIRDGRYCNARLIEKPLASDGQLD